MADYYTQFSASIDRLTEDERVWLTEQLNQCFGSDSPGDQHGEGGSCSDRDERVAQEDVEEYDDQDEEHDDDEDDEGEEDDAVDFVWEFDRDSLSLWTMTGTGECLEVIPSLVQEFLQKFRPQESWCMAFALTCDRPVVNQITGGALFVTAQGYEYMDGFQWIGEMRRRHHQVQGKVEEV